MGSWLDAVRTNNASFGSFVGMRNLFGQAPLFSSLFSGIRPASYHDNAGVLAYVNPKIGTYGTSPNGNGGMIPSTPQTRENFISQCPYHDADEYIHGFQATHQPAIWMGESGQVVLTPGVGDVDPLFTRRAHAFSKDDEVSTPYVYDVVFDAQTVEVGGNLTESIYSPVPGGEQPVPEDVARGANGRSRRDVQYAHATSHLPSPEVPQPESTMRTNGTIKVDMTASSHTGFMRVVFQDIDPPSAEPYIFIQATRANWTGHVRVNPRTQEVYGNNRQRQDYALGPSRAASFSGYFVSRFSHPFTSYGAAHGDILYDDLPAAIGEHVGAYVKFEAGTQAVEVRTGVSFVSVEQARRNLDLEGSPDVSFDEAVSRTKQAWLGSLDRIHVEGVNQTDNDHDPRTIFYTSLFHALQYPNDFSEPTDADAQGERVLYSGYTDSVHHLNDSYYQSWSIWDTFRAEHSLLTLLAPERVNSMMRSLLQIYDWAGWLPMWANVVETNIMIGTHVDAVIANALERGFKQFDLAKAWEAVKKNAYQPPVDDTALLYYDREGYTPDEVRAGLTAYLEKGYVPNDQWAESASRTLDYAFDDYAAGIVATHAGDNDTAGELFDRAAKNYKTIFNADTGFMQARNANGSWAGREQGWTEGDAWIYTFVVLHDPRGLAALLGGREKMRGKLDAYFEGGHNEHSNEPSHHAPYLYAAIGYPARTQEWVRRIAWENYNATSAGLSGNEDLGQMSAWYIFSALGFYPLNPAGDEYIVGSPFFEHISIRLPAGAATGGIGGEEHTLTISAPGAVSSPYVKGLEVDGVAVTRPVLKHKQIVTAERIVFEMADEPQSWGSEGM